MPRTLFADRLIYRLSNGPNGHALGTALNDANALTSSQKEDILTVGSKRMFFIHNHSTPYVLSFMESLGLYKKTLRASTRRIAYFPDKENKVRVVGILDYYSQMALKPLHNYLARALSKIRQDCTLNQGKFKELLLNKDIEEFHSIDLTAATDRFPIVIIKQLLLRQLPEPYVNAWERLMVGTPFDFGSEKISYSVGNPMGAYSSFNSFALAHHFIVYHCCKELGIS